MGSAGALGCPAVEQATDVPPVRVASAAPAVDRSPDAEAPAHATGATAILSRSEVLAVARQAIERNLNQA